MTVPPTSSDAYISELGIRNSAVAAATLIDRTYDEGLADQYKRELIQNALQAGARNIYASTLRIPGGPGDPVSGFKAAFVDDGEGMSPAKLLDYFGELFNGKSDIGPDRNFQMGARVSTLPWNPLGVIIASWTEGDPHGAELWIAYDETAKTYRFRPYRDDQGVAYETGTPEPYKRHPAIAKAGHGTVVILLGSRWEDHTIGEIGRAADGTFVYPATRSNDDDMFFYNAKWRALPDGVSLSYMWGTQELDRWAERIEPGQFYEQIRPIKGTDGVAGSVLGWHRGYLGVARQAERFAQHSGTVEVTSAKGYPATVHWALFPAEDEALARRTAKGGGTSGDRDRYIPLGLFGELHGDELYGLRFRGGTYPVMERYGITLPALRRRMVLMVEPHPRSARFIGARPIGSRKHLVIANGELPHAEWGEQFIAALPQPVRDALRELTGETGGDDQKRQQNRARFFREFFGRPFGAARTGEPVAPADVAAGRPRDTVADGGGGAGGGGTPGQTGHAAGLDLVPVAASSTAGRARRQDPPKPIEVTWPEEVFVEQAELEGLAAHWSPPSTLQLNPRHPVVVELIEAEKRARPGREERVEELARAAIAAHLVDTINAATIYSASRMARGQTRGKRFVDHAITDAALTAIMINVAAMEAVIRASFRGRPGFRVREDGAA